AVIEEHVHLHHIRAQPAAVLSDGFMQFFHAFSTSVSSPKKTPSFFQKDTPIIRNEPTKSKAFSPK
ncbi:MAG: hypothetical protein IKM64_07280, partial [Clostridia bacterium]|nr:hypothetical protein [Clostridia bacterium]